MVLTQKPSNGMIPKRSEKLHMDAGFTIIDYEERYKQELENISLPWLLEYDLLEPVDLAVSYTHLTLPTN